MVESHDFYEDFHFLFTLMEAEAFAENGDVLLRLTIVTTHVPCG